MIHRLVALLSCLALVGCSSDGDGGENGVGTYAGDKLDGIWDVTMSPDESTAVIEISPTKFVFTEPSVEVRVVFSSTPSITAKDDWEEDGFAGTHENSPLELGAVPYALGGKWKLTGADRGECSADVAASALSIECLNAGWRVADVLGGACERGGYCDSDGCSEWYYDDVGSYYGYCNESGCEHEICDEDYTCRTEPCNEPDCNFKGECVQRNQLQREHRSSIPFSARLVGSGPSRPPARHAT